MFDIVGDAFSYERELIIICSFLQDFSTREKKVACNYGVWKGKIKLMRFSFNIVKIDLLQRYQ